MAKCTACARQVHAVRYQVLTGSGEGELVPSGPGMVVREKEVHGAVHIGTVHRALGPAGGRPGGRNAMTPKPVSFLKSRNPWTRIPYGICTVSKKLREVC